jgi:zinc transporter ZupT
MTAFLFSIGTFLSTLGGGFFGIRYRDRLHLIMSFTAGVLISVVFFEVIPEIFRVTKESQLDITPPLVALVIGFLAIHILEKAAALHGAHEEQYADHKHPVVGLVGALGLAFHSFLDGLGIGLGFHVSASVGLIIAIAVMAHDFSDGLNTVSLMLINRNKMTRVVALLLLDAIAPVLGVLVSYWLAVPDSFLVLYLGFLAGFLLYIGAADLLPEAHSQHSSYKLIGLTLLGIGSIFLVTRFA